MDFLKSFGAAAGTVCGLYAGYKVVVTVESYLRDREAKAKAEAAAKAPAAPAAPATSEA